jgi:hypothetical protein
MKTSPLEYRFPTPTGTGLGDRFGQYLQLATIGIILNATIYTQWNDRKNFWTNSYPLNILNYVRFPASLRIVKSLPQTLPILRNAGPGYQEGFDHIPETSYRMLSDNGIIPKIGRLNYMRAFLTTASQFEFLRPSLLPQRPYVAVHLRRGDRGGPADPPVDLLRYLHNLGVNQSVYVLSDSRIAKRRLCNVLKLCKTLPPSNTRETALQEFFALVNAELVVQSVVQSGQLGGWSSYSYVSSLIGSKHLVTCVPAGTRLVLAERYCRCKLFNVIPCNR